MHRHLRLKLSSAICFIQVFLHYKAAFSIGSYFGLQSLDALELTDEKVCVTTIQSSRKI